MPSLLIEELAKHLDLPADDVSTALTELVNEVKADIADNKPSDLPGVGTFQQENGEVTFSPADTLALSVNNRYAALDSEMVQLGFEEPEFPVSETLQEGNEQEIDQSLIDQIIADDMASQGLFLNDDDPDPHQASIDLQDSLVEEQTETELETNSPTPDATSSEPEVEPASMKEDDLNSNTPSDKDPLGSDTEWSPFFEELEGEEFDIDNTIDLSAEDWHAEVPTPPPSPFASSSDSSNTNADDLYFDVDADPDDTLFAPAGSIDVDDPSTEDMAWATAPLDDVTDFFEDDPSMSSSFSEEADVLSAMSAEDEFFSPVSGSASTSADDTMFSAETIYTEEASTEADDTIFLAPDQTVQAQPEADLHNQYAPPAQEPPAAAAAPPPKTRNPYAYREELRKSKKSTSSMPWIAGIVAAVLILGGGLAWWQGWLPFDLGGSTPTPPQQNVTSATPIETPAEQGNTLSETPVTDPGAEIPATTPETNPATTPDPTPPVVQPTPAPQRLAFNTAIGGWTVVVTSKEQRVEAEQIADNFAQIFSGSQVPVDILTTNDFERTRYRVGIGQFSSRSEANNFLNRSGSDLPGDAWLLRIE